MFNAPQVHQLPVSGCVAGYQEIGVGLIFFTFGTVGKPAVVVSCSVIWVYRYGPGVISYGFVKLAVIIIGKPTVIVSPRIFRVYLYTSLTPCSLAGFSQPNDSTTVARTTQIASISTLLFFMISYSK